MARRGPSGAEQEQSKLDFGAGRSELVDLEGLVNAPDCVQSLCESVDIVLDEVAVFMDTGVTLCKADKFHLRVYADGHSLSQL